MDPVAIKNALSAVDFSEWSGPVLRAAAQVSRLYGASLTVVYAEQFLPPPYFTEGDIKALADLHARQRRAAQQHLAELVRQQLDYPAQTRLVEAFPTEAILGTASELDAGLVVVGTHGRSGLDRLLMGSVAEKVIRRSQVPVLVVKRQVPLLFRRILCPVNHTPVALAALRHAVDLASRSGAELVVMEVAEGGGETTGGPGPQAWDRLIPSDLRDRCRLRPVVRHGEAAEQILHQAAAEQCDLVVIGAQHRPLLETTVLGTTSVRVMRHAPCSALIVTRPHP